jgi:hypothetical protein
MPQLEQLSLERRLQVQRLQVQRLQEQLLREQLLREQWWEPGLRERHRLKAASPSILNLRVLHTSFWFSFHFSFSMRLSKRNQNEMSKFKD